MGDAEPDLIRLSLAADTDLRPVVEVAVAVLARRMGFPDDEVQAARTATGEAFDDVTGGSRSGLVEVEIEVMGQQLVARVRSGAVEQAVRVPRKPASPPG